MKQELREPAIYNSVISAVATGASRANEISTKVGLESGVCAKYLRVLVDLGILQKETPITEKSGRKTIYRISDNFFRFWYRFVPGNMSLIAVGQWWGTDPETRKEVQIDLVGISIEGREYLIGSCKYRNEKIGVDELALLQRYTSVFRRNGTFHYIIFSKGGFTQALLDLEKQGEVMLLTLEDLYFLYDPQ